MEMDPVGVGIGIGIGIVTQRAVLLCVSAPLR
jgi:hypothetical protein